jgi:hypothetical protein
MQKMLRNRAFFVSVHSIDIYGRSSGYQQKNASETLALPGTNRTFTHLLLYVSGTLLSRGKLWGNLAIQGNDGQNPSGKPSIRNRFNQHFAIFQIRNTINALALVSLPSTKLLDTS